MTQWQDDDTKSLCVGEKANHLLLSAPMGVIALQGLCHDAGVWDGFRGSLVLFWTSRRRSPTPPPMFGG